MKKGTLLALLCAGAALCAGIYALLPRTADAPAPTPEPTDILVLSIPPDDIASLRWNYALRTMYFLRDGETWQYPEDEHFPLDQNGPRFQSLFTELSQITAGRYLPEVSDPSEYSMDAPVNVITVTRTDGSETTLTIGAQNPVTQEYYLQISGDAGVYLVSGALPQAFDCGLFDLIKIDPVPDFSTATEYRANGLTYSKNDTGQWCDSDGTPISTDLTAVLSVLSYSECIDYYADYYEAHHEYALTDGKTISVTYLANGEPAEWSLSLGHDYDETHVIVSPVGSDLVYTLDKTTVDALLLQ